MEKLREGVVAVILNADLDKVYMEERGQEQTYPGSHMFISGHIEPEDEAGEEIATRIAALRRELLEELGVDVETAQELSCETQPQSPGGTVLHPFIVTTIGELPDVVLDKGTRAHWVGLEAAVESDFESVRIIGNATLRYVQGAPQ